jgi:hypothetical protein
MLIRATSRKVWPLTPEFASSRAESAAIGLAVRRLQSPNAQKAIPLGVRLDDCRSNPQAPCHWICKDEHMTHYKNSMVDARSQSALPAD